jgi:integrase
MATVTVRNDFLILDFRYKDKRCREKTKFIDTPANRKKLKLICERLEAEIVLDSLDYAAYFPKSKRVIEFADHDKRMQQASAAYPTYGEFYDTWYMENEVRWTKSSSKAIRHNVSRYSMSVFRDTPIDKISRSDLLAFRADLSKGRVGLNAIKNVTVNKIMSPMRQILDEAAYRFDYPSPFINIKTLKKQRTDVNPFSTEEVLMIIKNIRADYRPYVIARFFTGMRTNEINGLKWKFVDFKRRQILVREGWVLGETTYLKTDGSSRDIDMSQAVFDCLQEQLKITKGQQYVFCNNTGMPINLNNFAKRVWTPLLAFLGIEYRKPYETRHTAATLWLASGEAPEYIARQMGHTTTEMLFRVYSRYVPNLTRNDGSAFDKMISNTINPAIKGS